MADSNPYLTFWMSRDLGSDGVLSPNVDIWLERPTRINLPSGGACWLGPGETGVERRHAIWTVAAALHNCRVYPETTLECIRVGPEPIPVKDS